MAQTLSFYKGNASSFENNYKEGCVYFENDTRLLKVGKGGASFDVYSGVRSANFENNVLTIVNQAGVTFELDFSDVASAEGISSILSSLRDDVNSVKASVEGLGKPAVLYTAEEAAAANAQSGASEGDENYIAAGDVKEAATGLYKDIADVKEELGESASEGQQSLGQRIDSVESKIGEEFHFDSITPEEYAALSEEDKAGWSLEGNSGNYVKGVKATGVYAALSNIEEAADDAQAAAEAAQGDVDSLKDIVGDSQSGLVKDVADAASAAGNAQTDATQALSDAADAKEAADAAQADADALKAIVGEEANEEEGTEATGLVARVGALEGAGYITSSDIPVIGIASGEKIISLSGDKKLSSTLNMSYADGSLKLTGINGEQIGDAVDCSVFLADGILENVELVDLAEDEVEGKDAGRYFKFSWNTAADKEPIYVSMAEFGVATYEAGKDLDLTDGVFDVALDEDIEITGVKVGNLGVDVLKLDKGMSLSEILTAMLCKDIDVKVNANPSLGSITSSLTSTSYEVGDVVPSFTLSVSSYNDGSFVSSDTSLYSATKFADVDHNGASPLAAGCAVGNYTWTGTNPSTKGIASVDSFTITSGQSYTVKAAYGASTVTPKTLLKKDSSVSIAAGTTATKTYSLSVYYNDFYGAIPASGTEVTVNGLSSTDGLTLSGVKHSTSAFTISCPAGSKGAYIWTKSTVKSFKNGTDEFVGDLKKVTVNYTNGETVTAYNLYSFPNVDGFVQKTDYVVILN